MNPINSLSANLQKTATALKEKTESHAKLTVAHSKLVDDFVVAENRLDSFSDAVQEMCSNCSQIGSLNCGDCPLSKFL